MFLNPINNSMRCDDKHLLPQEFLFPVKFLSGRIHELKIHIPWTSLGSDSVVITLNTLECSLTYRPLQETKRGATEIVYYSIIAFYVNLIISSGTAFRLCH